MENTQTGRRPSFTQAMPPAEAEKLYEVFTQKLQVVMGENLVAKGSFGASMEVELINDGPVTLLLTH